VGFDVDATDGAVLVGDQPLIHAVRVEEVHAWQAPVKGKFT